MLRTQTFDVAIDNALRAAKLHNTPAYIVYEHGFATYLEWEVDAYHIPACRIKGIVWPSGDMDLWDTGW